MNMLVPNEMGYQRLILRVVARDGTLSQRKIAKAVGVSAPWVNTQLDRLRSQGKISVQGLTNRSMSYTITPYGEGCLAKLEKAFQEDVARLIEGRAS